MKKIIMQTAKGAPSPYYHIESLDGRENGVLQFVEGDTSTPPDWDACLDPANDPNDLEVLTISDALWAAGRVAESNALVYNYALKHGKLVDRGPVSFRIKF